MKAVLNIMIINDQNISFGPEYDQLERGENVDSTSNIYSMSPYMENGIIKM